MNNINQAKIRVLVVDDSEPFRSMLTHFLENMGLEAMSVENATQALNVFEPQPSAFDLIVTDFNMPGPSGADLIKRVLASTPTPPPMVLFTGLDFNNHEIQKFRSETKNHNRIYVLSKSCAFEEFREILRQTVGI